jgi:hypothetical protein
VKARARTALTTLALLALAGGALVWATYGVDRKVDAERAAKEREEKVFSFDAKDVVELTIAAKGGTTRLVRHGDGWRIAAPLDAEADRFAANAIAEKLASLKRTREVAPPPGGDLARYGLAEPALRVEATLADGRKETLAAGDESAFDGSLFVRPTTGAVLVVPGDVRFTLERDATALREKRLVRFDREKVAVVDAGAWKLERRGEGWSLPGGPADPAKVSALLGALETLRATRFLDGAAPSTLGLARPSRTVRLADGAGNELARLEVGKVQGDDAFVRSGRVPAAVPKAALDAIPREGAELVAKPLDSPSPPPPVARETNGVDQAARSP